MVGLAAPEVNRARARATDALDSIGLVTHELTQATLVDEALGIVVDGERKCIRLTSKRMGRLRCTLRWILNRNELSGEQLEVVIGHLTFALCSGDRCCVYFVRAIAS